VRFALSTKQSDTARAPGITTAQPTSRCSSRCSTPSFAAAAWPSWRFWTGDCYEFGVSGRVYDHDSIIGALLAGHPTRAMAFNYGATRLSADVVLLAARSDTPSLRRSIWSRGHDAACRQLRHQSTRAAPHTPTEHYPGPSTPPHTVWTMGGSPFAARSPPGSQALKAPTRKGSSADGRRTRWARATLGEADSADQLGRRPAIAMAESARFVADERLARFAIGHLSGHTDAVIGRAAIDNAVDARRRGVVRHG
jgi:hypothetical protein